MPRRGSWEARNATYKERRVRKLAEAPTDAKRLGAAFDWVRASTALLAKRQVPLGQDKDDNRAAAGTITSELTRYLATLAQAIDNGDYDAGRGDSR